MTMNRGDYNIVVHASKDGTIRASMTDVVGFEYTREHESKWVELLQNMLDKSKIKFVSHVEPMNAYWDDEEKEDCLIKIIKMLSEKPIKVSKTLESYKESLNQTKNILGLKILSEKSDE